MNQLLLRLHAPFAAFRWLQAGVYRASSPVIPPSAAWGLLLNFAGIDTRGKDVGGVTTVRPDAPAFEVAIGAFGACDTSTLYQQLHTYPVGSSGANLKERTHGAKYWIAPARREILVGFECVLGARGDGDVLDRIVAGLAGRLDEQRYGLPHAGDNNLLFDRADVVDSVSGCHWYTRIGPDDPPRRGSCRLTIGIDRSDSSRTTTALFAPVSEPSPTPPEAAWTWVPRGPAE